MITRPEPPRTALPSSRVWTTSTQVTRCWCGALTASDARSLTCNRWWSAFGKKTRGKGRRPGPPVHDDRVQRQFQAAAPNELWLADISEHQTAEGKLYICAVKDVFFNRPFKGVYRYGNWPDGRLQGHVYPVPDPRNPFLGVHTTVTVDGHVKIGPTAIAALGRENYEAMSGLTPEGVADSLTGLARFLTSCGRPAAH